MQKSPYRLLGLFITEYGTGRTLPRKRVELDIDGVKGDKHYAKERSRSVLITSDEAYRIAEEAGIEISYGALGENILVEGDLHELSPGDRLRIGESTLEIVQKCPLCSHLSAIDSALPKLLKNDRGVFARVEEEGEITLSDEITLFSKATWK